MFDFLRQMKFKLNKKGNAVKRKKVVKDKFPKYLIQQNMIHLVKTKLKGDVMKVFLILIC